MPYCPKCRFDYRAGMAVCPDCGEALLEGSVPPPGREHRPSPETEPVRLCRVADPNEAEIIHAALTEAGIQSVIQEYGPITARLTRVVDGATHDYAIIFVTRNRLEEARRILDEIRSGPVIWPEGMEPQD